MTSTEIKAKEAVDLSTTGWLREICYQLALLNEKPEPAAKPAAPTPQYHPKGRR